MLNTLTSKGPPKIPENLPLESTQKSDEALKLRPTKHSEPKGGEINVQIS